MKDLVQCTVTHNNFQQWLVWGKASLTFLDRNDQPVCPLVKVDLTPELEYLYHVPFQSGSITWDNAPVFVGVYHITNDGDNALYLTREFAASSACGQAGLVSADWKDRPTVLEEMNSRVGQYIDRAIGNDRRNLSVAEVTGWVEARELRYYLEHGAKEDAERRFFEDDPPDGRFWHGYSMDSLKESAFLAYLQAPENFIQTEAEQFMEKNQESFLLQFLKNEALLAEYQALEQDTGSPLHRMRAIARAVKGCGAKTVNVTVQKGGKELTFKTETSPLIRRGNFYSAYSIAASDRRRFEEEFGRSADYKPEDVMKITYGRNTIYEARPDQTEDLAEGMSMGQSMC